MVMSFEDNGLVIATEILLLIFLLGSASSEAYSKVLFVCFWLFQYKS